MSEYYVDGGNDGKRKFGRLGSFLVGLLGGGLAGAGLAAFFVKKICDSEKDEAVIKAQNDAIAESTKVAQQWIGEHITVASPDGVKDAIAKAFGVDSSLLSDDEPEYSIELPMDEDIENYDLTIDDKEASDEALERTEQHEKYLDMIEKYQNNDSMLRPRRISRDEFEGNQHYEKVTLSWYEDNVFASDLENDRALEDPYTDLGVQSGMELFSRPDADDPNVVYIRNERQSIDYEITRTFLKYSKVQSKEAYFDGESN